MYMHTSGLLPRLTLIPQPSQANTRCGSPIYMAPEICQAKPYDRGADAWALG